MVTKGPPARASASEAGDRADAQFRRAVAALVANCGEHARHLLRSGHPHLTRKVILQLSRTTPERQRFEVEQILLGRRPFSTKTNVFDTTGYGEVGSRLARAGGNVNHAATVILRLTATDRTPRSRQ